jgi:hypothetical protein
VSIFIIHFCYSENGRLRAKTHKVEAMDANGAVDKVRRTYGIVKILRIEKE